MTFNANHSDTIERLLQSLEISKVYGSEGEDLVRQNIITFSESTLALIARTAAWNREHGNLKISYMYTVLANRESLVRRQLFKRLAFSYPTSTAESVEIINGLQYTDYFHGSPKLEELTGYDLDVARSLLNVTAAVMDHLGREASVLTEQGPAGSVVYLSDPDLATLVTSNPKRMDDIISFIDDRKMIDVEQLRSYLSNETPLANGTL